MLRPSLFSTLTGWVRAVGLGEKWKILSCRRKCVLVCSGWTVGGHIGPWLWGALTVTRELRCGPLRLSPETGELWVRRAGLRLRTSSHGNSCANEAALTRAPGDPLQEFVTQGVVRLRRPEPGGGQGGTQVGRAELPQKSCGPAQGSQDQKWLLRKTVWVCVSRGRRRIMGEVVHLLYFIGREFGVSFLK